MTDNKGLWDQIYKETQTQHKLPANIKNPGNVNLVMVVAIVVVVAAVKASVSQRKRCNTRKMNAIYRDNMAKKFLEDAKHAFMQYGAKFGSENAADFQDCKASMIDAAKYLNTIVFLRKE